ncbi:hypothetical protein F4V56_07945 [Corynebacterium spheniscorum]|nr:hypothetical protein [Corynebacterium spheniscorum]KAA8720418.1 hypothetical protein F4V56_07945 [Corynebacterium spheniscorum]
MNHLHPFLCMTPRQNPKSRQSALTTAQELITHQNATNDDGVPAAYDTAIDSEYQHSMGIQQGWVGS